MSRTSFALGAVVFLAILAAAFAFASTAAHADALDDQLKARQAQLEELQRKSQIYDANIKLKSSQAATLKNQISILNDQIEKAKSEIEQAKLKLEGVNGQIANVQATIDKLTTDLRSSQADTARLLQDLQTAESENLFLLFWRHRDWSEVLTLRQRRLQLNQELTKRIISLQQNQGAYERLAQELNSQKADAIELQNELQGKTEQLADKTEEKKVVLNQTKSQEAQFQKLLQQVKKDTQQINAEIASLERQARARIAAQQKAASDAAAKKALQDKLGEVGPGGLSWPVPSRRVNAFFHDPTYPFRNVYEHPAIDIGGTPQGTPVRATAAGYVGTVKDAGKGYSYIMLIHGDGISTVYGHLSALYAKRDSYVARGEVIGLSGGAPGTNGAGSMTTGAHLHFEVRKDGIPVNPLDYLPN